MQKGLNHTSDEGGRKEIVGADLLVSEGKLEEKKWTSYALQTADRSSPARLGTDKG